MTRPDLAAPPLYTASTPDIRRDPRLCELDGILSRIDQVRRLLAGGDAPLAEVYLEGARGNLQHARSAVIRRLRANGCQWTVELGSGAKISVIGGERICRLVRPKGWRDEMLPPRADLGADLIRSEMFRSRASGRWAAAMLAAALADHSWLHVASGTEWATDRSGALALVSALSGGRPVDMLAVEDLDGALEEGLLRDMAALGWRRLTTPRLSS